VAELGPAEIETALQRWSQGDHTTAVETVRPAAELGDRAGLTLIAWFQVQRGDPHWRDGLPYAEAAVKKGVPWIASYYIPHMLNDPTFRTRVPDLLRSALEVGSTIDPLAYVMNPVGQGDLGTSVRLAEVATMPRLQPEAWTDLVQRVTHEWDAVSAAVAETATRKAEALHAIDADQAEIAARRAEVENRTTQLIALIERATTAEVQSFFEDEAATYGGEARRAWSWGIGLLGAATAFALAPIVIYYLGTILDKDWLAKQNLTAAHFAPAVALGAVAGVLLARARGRDRARQRARDLSVALLTMFAYSAQITSPEERQRFLHDMARVVIEAFLRQDGAPAEGESASLLAALARRG
jgi:hypothetical protein